MALSNWQLLRQLRNRGTDPTVVYGEVSVTANAWTTVVSLTPTEDRIMTSFGADLVALLSTNYEFRLLLDGAVKWHEIAGTTSVGAIVARMLIPSGSTVQVQILHGEAAATQCGGSISHEGV